MVNLPPPDSNDRPSSPRLRDRDEGIAVAIAFLVIGAVLWWGWTRGQQLFALDIPELPALLEQPILEEDDVLGAADIDEDPEDANRFFRSGPITEEEAAIVDAPERPIFGTRNRTLESVPLQEDPEAELEAGETEATTTTPSNANTPPPLNISDVSSDYWAYPFIVDLYDADLLPDLPGGNLQPDKQLTRAEFAALLNESFVQGDASEVDLTFSDVSDSYWAANAIRQVVEAGYMRGFPDGTFKPDELVPRYQVLVTLASGLDLADPDNARAILSTFQGVENLPEWSVGQVAAAAQNRLVVNHPDPNDLAPQEPATRAEIIVMMHQALLSQGRVDAIESPYVAPQQ